MFLPFLSSITLQYSLCLATTWAFFMDAKREKRTEKVQTHLTESEKNAFLEVAEREGIPPAILLRKALNFFLDFSGYFTQSNSTKPEAGSKTKESFRFKKLPMFLCF